MINVFYKLFARIYQSCFKLAIPILPYRNPIVYENVNEIKKILSSEDKPLIVTDKVIISNGLLDYITKFLEENHIVYSLFSDVCPNPTSLVVNEALA